MAGENEDVNEDIGEQKPTLDTPEGRAFGSERAIQQRKNELLDAAILEVTVLPEFRNIWHTGRGIEQLEIDARQEPLIKNVWLRPPDAWSTYVDRLAVLRRQQIVASTDSEYVAHMSPTGTRPLMLAVAGIAVAVLALPSGYGVDIRPPKHALEIALAALVIAIVASTFAFALHKKFPESSQSQKAPDDPKLRAAVVEALTHTVKSAFLIAANRWVEDSYANRIHDGEKRQDPLSEDRMVVVPATQTVLDIISSRSGASIGIAGSRGTGKSTLLEWCEGLAKDHHNKSITAVKVSAPVDYEAREFILYLFAQVCLKLGAQNRNDTWATENERSWTRSLITTNVIAFLVTIIATASVAAGGWLMAEYLSLPDFHHLVERIPRNFPQTPPEPNFAGDLDERLLFAVFYAAFWYVSRPSDIAVTATGVGALVALHKSWMAFKIWLRMLASAVAAYALCGLTVGQISASFAGGVFLVSSSVAFYTHARSIRNGRPGRQTLSGARLRAAPFGKVQEIADLAQRALDGVRYQQTQSWEKSGKLGFGGLPIQIVGEAASKRATTRNELPKNLPDIINDFQALLWAASRDAKIVIAIDELDKIHSTESAARFLNEIKAIFDVRRTYFFVSISDDAMHSFDRRGMPFRDAFDTAFNDVVHIEHGDLNQTKAIVNAHLFVMTVPAIAFCHVLAGGLPRDSLRVGRKLQRLDRETPLDEAVRDFLTLDVRQKLSAIAADTAGKSTEPFVGALILILGDLSDRLSHEQPQTNQTKESLVETLNESRLRIASMSFDASAPDAESLALRQLSLEFCTYLYFAVTVIEYFSADAYEPDEIANCEILARARHAFALHPVLTWQRISQFRTSVGLTSENVPSWTQESLDITDDINISGHETPATASDS